MTGNNPNREHALELKAGVFVLIGLIFIAMMAFKFGRLGQGLFQQYYPITVTFPSADGPDQELRCSTCRRAHRLRRG